MVDHVGEPFLWVDTVFLAGAEETVEHGYSFGCIVASGKEVVFAAYGQGPDGVFDQVAVDFQHPVL